MNLINIENLSKTYNEKQILENVNFYISEEDKIGLIGVNGTGKSTLLKLIVGLETPDKGRIIKSNDLKIEYLFQETEFDSKASVLEQVFNGNSQNIKILKEYTNALNTPDSNDKIISLSKKMDEIDGWSLESKAKSILTKLGINNFKQSVGKLSGGQKKRIALASALINPSDLLILDEPTNHLDNETIEWLEDYLKNRKGALLMITHDRYFLDRVVSRIVELDNGNLYKYDGNYTYFLEKKFEREQIALSTERKQKSILRKELAWMKQGAKARSTKQKARIDRFNELNEATLDTLDENIDITVAKRRLGKKIIEIEGIKKSFKDNLLIKNFSYNFLRDDRIGIIGPNGTGKSTLLNIISKKIKADAGKVDIGETVKIGVFSQDTSPMEENLRVIEYIKEGGEFIQTNDGAKISASQMLERFLFVGEAQWRPIEKLSGGEKRRLQLLRVLIEAPNVLFLDEPTNDLDIDTIQILEDYLDEFQGAVAIVSHDRYFLDRVVEKVFAFEGSGKIKEYTGNYSYYKEKIEKKAEKEDKIRKEEKRSSKTQVQKSNSNLKFSYNEKREWESIDENIASLESEIQSIDEKITKTTSDYVELEKLLKEKEDIEDKLEHQMARWVYLSELQEKIEQQKR